MIGWGIGYTYFGRREKDGAIKIGRTWSPRINVRMYTLQIELKYPVEPLCMLIGEHHEIKFHAMFEPHHIGNEWFEPHQDILDAVDQINAETFDLSTLPAQGWCVTKPYQTKASLAHWGPLPRFAERRAA